MVKRAKSLTIDEARLKFVKIYQLNKLNGYES